MVAEQLTEGVKYSFLLLNFPKLVLATTKDWDHRIYLGQRIYAGVILRYQCLAKSYAPVDWTYAD